MKLWLFAVAFLILMGSVYSLEILVNEKTDGPHMVYSSSFAVSPDGTKVAYIGDRWVNQDGTLDLTHFVQNDILIKDLMTGKFQKFYIPNYFNNSYGGLKYIDWSPDGQKIAFAFGVDYVHQSLYVIDSDGNISSLEQLTFDETVFRDVSFSEDSKKILYIKKPNREEDPDLNYYDGGHIYSIDLGTKQRTCLSCFMDDKVKEEVDLWNCNHFFHDASWNGNEVYYNCADIKFGTINQGAFKSSLGTGYLIRGLDIYDNNLVYIQKETAGSYGAGEKLIYGAGEKLIKVRDLDTGEEKTVFNSPSGLFTRIEYVVFYDNGEKIAFLGSYKSIGGIFSINASGETCSLCPSDCGICELYEEDLSCGDGKCSGVESCSSCAADCGAVCKPGYITAQSGGFIKAINGTGAFNYNDGPMSDLLSVDFISEKIGWVVGWNTYNLDWGSNTPGLEVSPGKIYKTTDGGNSWISQSMPEAGTSGDVNADAALYSVEALDSSTVLAVGKYGLILRTTDGSVWKKVYGQTSTTNDMLFSDIDFVGEIGYVVGGDDSSGVVMKSTNGGKTWDKKSVGDHLIRSVDFISSDVGWISTESGIVMKTTDGGKKWVSQLDKGFDVTFYSVDFIDENTGFVSGGIAIFPDNSGVIYKTTDGGSSWAEVGSADGSDLISSVMSVSFISPLEGWASLYSVGSSQSKIIHTTDGGATWSSQNIGKSVGAITHLDFVMGNDESVENSSVSKAIASGGDIVSQIINFFKSLFGLK